MEFKDILRQQRIAHGLTQQELGEKVGLKKEAIYKYEKGIVVNPKRSLIAKLAKIFNVSPSYLLGITEDENKPTYYTDPETAKLAQLLHDNPQFRVMFDATKDMDPETVQKIIEFIKYQRHLEGYDD